MLIGRTEEELYVSYRYYLIDGNIEILPGYYSF